MIEFECPECGALNEVSDRKAGRRVRCERCDERIDVPDDGPRRPLPKRDPRQRDRLSKEEYVLYGGLFLLAPAINVLVSSFFYFMWRESLPTRAYQINQLGWIIFLIQVVPSCLCCCLAVGMNPRERNFGPPRR